MPDKDKKTIINEELKVSEVSESRRPYPRFLAPNGNLFSVSPDVSRSIRVVNFSNGQLRGKILEGEVDATGYCSMQSSGNHLIVSFHNSAKSNPTTLVIDIDSLAVLHKFDEIFSHPVLSDAHQWIYLKNKSVIVRALNQSKTEFDLPNIHDALDLLSIGQNKLLILRERQLTLLTYENKSWVHQMDKSLPKTESEVFQLVPVRASKVLAVGTASLIEIDFKEKSFVLGKIWELNNALKKLNSLGIEHVNVVLDKVIIHDGYHFFRLDLEKSKISRFHEGDVSHDFPMVVNKNPFNYFQKQDVNTKLKRELEEFNKNFNEFIFDGKSNYSEKDLENINKICQVCESLEVKNNNPNAIMILLGCAWKIKCEVEKAHPGSELPIKLDAFISNSLEKTFKLKDKEELPSSFYKGLVSEYEGYKQSLQAIKPKTGRSR